MARRYQSAADYAAIGLAPLLIFIMLGSLAAFLNLLVYHGPYAQRVPTILLFYTMGTVALARVTIENSRAYSLVYAIGLGGAAFFVMLRFFGNPIFSAFILILIGYLADRITHDCTIIDDGIDSSGRGLIDSLSSSAKKRFDASEDSSPVAVQGRQGHQPGRTVLFLAAGALPLFGLGQFFLADAPGAWPAARWFLTIYLFSSLSLLVVTSFLNTRRYLRQRDTEMPTDVTFAWVAGGIAMIVLVLEIAYLAPLPGRAIASVRVPEFLMHKEPFTASKYGWGNEGAEKSNPDVPPTATQGPPPEPSDSKQENSTMPGGIDSPAPQPGGDRGNNPDAPAGQDPGGKKKSQGSEASEKGEKSESSQPSSPPEQSGKKGEPKPSEAAPKDQPSESPDNKAPDNEASDSKSPDKTTPDKPQPSEDSGESKPPEPSKNPEQNQEPEQNQKSEQPDQSQPPSDEEKPDQSEKPSEPEPSEPKPSEPKPSESRTSESRTSDAAASEPPPPVSPPASSSMEWLSSLGGLLKWLIFAALLGLVIFQVWRNYDAIVRWWESLWSPAPRDALAMASGPAIATGAPPRRFSSFQNPIGSTDDSSAVVITFQALEAWCRERGVTRGREETPNEFIARAIPQFPSLREPGLRVVDAYNRIVYGGGKASPPDVQAAAGVWKAFRA